MPGFVPGPVPGSGRVPSSGRVSGSGPGHFLPGPGSGRLVPGPGSDHKARHYDLHDLPGPVPADRGGSGACH
jgi:hypothetical protein